MTTGLLSILICGLSISSPAPIQQAGIDFLPAEVFTENTIEVFVVNFEKLDPQILGKSTALLSGKMDLAIVPLVEEKIVQLAKWKEGVAKSGLTQFAIVSYTGKDQGGSLVVLMKCAGDNADLESVTRALGEMPWFPFDDFPRSRFQLIERLAGEPKQFGRWQGWIVGNYKWNDLVPDEMKHMSFATLIQQVEDAPVFGASVPNKTLRSQLAEYLDSIYAGASIGWHWTGILAEWKRSLPDSGGSFAIKLDKEPIVRWATSGEQLKLDDYKVAMNLAVGRSRELFPFFADLLPDGIEISKQGNVISMELDQGFFARTVDLWKADKKQPE